MCRRNDSADSGRRARRGGHRPVLDEQRVGAHPDEGMIAGEFAGQAPVCGRGAAVEETGLGGHERAAADRGDQDAAVDGRAQGIQGHRIRVGAAARTRHDHRVGSVEDIEPVPDHDIESAGSRGQYPRLGRADHHPTAGFTVDHDRAHQGFRHRQNRSRSTHSTPPH